MNKERIQTYNDDCMNVLRKIDDLSIDMIVTDPPYGMSFQSNRAKTGPRHRKITNDEEVFHEWLPECYRILKTGGGIITFCDWKTSNIWKEHLENYGFKINSQVVWNRLHHGMGDLYGSFSPMHDIIWYATKGRRIFKNKRPSSVLNYKRPSPSQDYGHPTCKPVELMKELIQGTHDGSKEGIIIDPFMGSGSTGVAAKELNLPFIGIEIDKKYYNIAKNRLITEESYSLGI